MAEEKEVDDNGIHVGEEIVDNRIPAAPMRYYEKVLPDTDEVVMCQVRQIAEMGAYVKLLEYNGAEGMILLSELSRRRIRSIQKLVRVGRNEVVVVLRVDKEKGYIDLSKRRVSPDDVEKCEERYNKGKAVNTILSHIAFKLQKPIEELYETISWPLDKKYGHAFDAFKIAVTESATVFEGMTIDEDIFNELTANIVRRLTPHAVRIRADIEVTCFSSEGIDAIKKALVAGESLSTEAIPLKVKLVAPPLYVLLTMTTEKQRGLDLLKESLEKIGSTIRNEGGEMRILKEPQTVSDKEDQELEQLMARAQLENTEVEGDDDSDQGD